MTPPAQGLGAATLAFCSVVACHDESGFDSTPKSEWGRADAIRIVVPDYPEPTTWRGFTALTTEMTGVEFEEGGGLPGALSLVPIRDDAAEGLDLGDFSSGTCTPWVAFNPTSSLHFSHVLGHSIGLEDSQDPCNFMFEPHGRLESECSTGFFADEEQIDELRAYAWALENVCDEF